MERLRNLYESEEGGSLMEYAFLASLIGMATIGAMSNVGGALVTQLAQIADVLN